MKIVILDGGILNPGDADWSPLEALGDLEVYDESSGEQIARRARGAEIVLVNKVPLGREVLGFLENCRLIGVLAAGVNNLDLDALAGAGIAVCNAPGYGDAEVAQHALALLLELANHVALEAAAVRAGEWKRRGVWSWRLKPPLSLAGRVMGIIGFGAIGRRTGRLANALGMRVLGASRSRREPPAWSPFSFATPAEIFREADVISLHCPLTPETAKIVNAESLAAMKPGALIINTARGGLVDEGAVAAALAAGRLAGYGADVLGSEPPRGDNPLLSAPNAIVTPHLAWTALEARQRIIDITAKNIRAFLAGEAENRVI